MNLSFTPHLLILYFARLVFAPVPIISLILSQDLVSFLAIKYHCYQFAYSLL